MIPEDGDQQQFMVSVRADSDVIIDTVALTFADQ